MRILLAIASFIIGTLCLGYCALIVFGLSQGVLEFGFNEFVEVGLEDGWQSEIAFALILGGVSFLVGIGFAVAGLLVLKKQVALKQ